MAQIKNADKAYVVDHDGSKVKIYDEENDWQMVYSDTKSHVLIKLKDGIGHIVGTAQNGSNFTIDLGNGIYDGISDKYLSYNGSYKTTTANNNTVQGLTQSAPNILQISVKDSDFDYSFNAMAIDIRFNYHTN